MAIRFKDKDRKLTLGVGELLAAGPTRGHLRLDFAGSSSARMAAGRQVHVEYQEDRALEEERFAAEVSVKVTAVVRGWECTVRGRLDGLIQEEERTVVEEIKSTGLDHGRLLTTDLDDWPLYRAQVDLYLWMLTRAGYPDPVGRLVLVSLIDSSRHVLHVDTAIHRVEAFVLDRLDYIVRDREERLAWLATRQSAEVPFAHPGFRPGQREIVADIEEKLSQKKHLLMTAPTGTGKTAAALHAVLRYAYRNDLRVFVATAKGTQQAIAQQTLAAIQGRGLPLRAVTIRAKEKACLNDTVDCRPESCKYAESYYDKLLDEHVVERVKAAGVATPDAVAAEAKRSVVCPFELSLQLSDHADVVIGDYNYVFGPFSYLRRHFGDRHRDWILVVDEAHNLVERARSYGSPRLLARVAEQAAAFLSGVDASRFLAFIELCDDLAQAVRDAALRVEADAPRQDREAVVSLNPRQFLDLRDRADEIALDYLRLRDPGWPIDPYTDLIRELMRFASVLELSGQEGDDVLHLYQHDPFEGPAVQLLCLDPSPWTGRRLDGFHGSVLMSATLRPARFHRDLLGIPEERFAVSEHPSPFPPENRGVVLASRVSTAYRDRAAHRERTGELLQRVAEATPGNVAIYYSSFGLLASLSPLVEIPGRATLVQQRRMSEDDRAAMVAALVEEGPPRVMHAVLGGIFAEGIDLPEGALKTVVLVGPALPGVDLQRTLFKEWCEERFDQGFNYAYLVPGMSRVVQAGGRIVRRATDRGAVVLVGRRFGWRDYAALLPPDWHVSRADDPARWVAEFWSAQGSLIPGV
jgi:DNA excision repair protein ERCC-2